MADRRRGRWFAFDAFFFDGTLGLMIRERFGTAGIALFVGFLGACKRSPIPGQIQYGSVPDALSLMGLPGVELVDESGVAFELQSFWRALAAHKQCSTSTRGRLTQVRCTNWAKWQEDFGREKAATRKGRSRAMNSQDNPPTPSGQPPDDIRLASADFDPDPDIDLDPDNHGNLSSSNHHVAEPVENEEEDNPRVQEALALLAHRRRSKRTGPPIVDLPAWMAKTIAGLRAEHFDTLVAMCVNGTTPEAMADAIEPPTASASLAAAKPSTPVWDLDEAGNAVPLVTP